MTSPNCNGCSPELQQWVNDLTDQEKEELAVALERGPIHFNRLMSVFRNKYAGNIPRVEPPVA